MSHGTRSKRGKGGHGSRGSGAPVEVTVEHLSWGGRGVAHLDGKVVFVSKAVPGDRASVRVTRDRKSFAEARLLSISRPGEGRVDPGCPWFERCGGCQWLAAAYPVQIREKEAILRGALRHHLDGVEVEPVVSAEPPLAYRHRGDFHLQTHDGRVRLGFFEEGSHRLSEVTGCLLFAPAFNAMLERVRSALSGLPSASLLERLTLAHSEGQTESLVAHGRMRSGLEDEAALSLVEPLMACGLKGVVLTQGRGGSVLASSGDTRLRFGVPGPKGELSLGADVRSFTQAHFAMNRKLVAGTAAWLGATEQERVLDLYAGVGNFTLSVAQGCKEVVAVEGSPFACADASLNAAENGIPNILHLEDDVARAASGLVEAGERFDAVLLDPPRTGAKEVLPALARFDAARVLYVSCNLPSLERDLGVLRRLGYRLTRLRGFDCFPQTYGLETLCLLERAQ